jgi:complex iron-sulfur molybdoenzyme family reductase subunit gamma
MKSRLAKPAAILSLVLIAVALRVTDANPALAQTQTIGAWRVSAQPSMDGSTPEWQSILPVFLPTTAQQVTPPMGGGTVERLAVRAVHWEDRLYVMLEWSDFTPDYLSDRHEAFTDAAAIQFPAEAGSEVPAICMGQADQAVNLWQWRSDQQEDLPELPADGYTDLYPSTDDLYFPARAAGNPLSQLDRSPVRNLVAGGFGTLTAADQGELQGHGLYSDGRWMVVYSRPFDPSGELQPAFGGEQSIDVAFAVWDGSKGERDGIKSVSAFTQLVVTPEDPPRRSVAATDDWPAYVPPNPVLGVTVGFLGALLATGLGVWGYLRGRVKEPDVDQQ